jgi:hypothetical protein
VGLLRLMVLAALAAGCGAFGRRGASTDSPAADSAVPSGPMLTELPAEPPPDLLAREVRQACAAVAGYWSHDPQAVVTGHDSTITMPGTHSTADACWVRVRVEDVRRLAPSPQGEPRVPFGASGWLRIIEFDADGPDGQSTVYQLDPVRCLVSEHWDGGDDADTTYVPAPWFEQEVACWKRR